MRRTLDSLNTDIQSIKSSKDEMRRTLDSLNRDIQSIKWSKDEMITTLNALRTAIEQILGIIFSLPSPIIRSFTVWGLSDDCYKGIINKLKSDNSVTTIPHEEKTLFISSDMYVSFSFKNQPENNNRLEISIITTRSVHKSFKQMIDALRSANVDKCPEQKIGELIKKIERELDKIFYW